MFAGCVGCVDGLLAKMVAPSIHDTLNVIRYFSGAKGGYGLNIQAIATAKYRFLAMSCKCPGATNDWTAWLSSFMADATAKLPRGYYLLGDAAYPISNQLLTPYPGTGLAPGMDSFNFHLSQLRVKVEQSFGILVARWGILWRPKLIRTLFHLHNFFIDEGSNPIAVGDESAESGKGRPSMPDAVLPDAFWTTVQGGALRGVGT